ncbi:MAG: MerR family transcriptional regulator [Bacteroidia bacterium]|nr:MerR family transcriptional regulator [Bacteroidia bacterium]
MDEIQKQYYTIGEVSKLLKIQPSVLRFWETEFKQIQPRKNRKGNRVYTPKDIELLTYIRFLLKEKAFTIKGAQRILNGEEVIPDEELQTQEGIKRIDLQSVSVSDKDEVKELLRNLKNFLVYMKNNL